MKKYFFDCLICLTFLGIFSCIQVASADTGWDYDYNRGSSQNSDGWTAENLYTHAIALFIYCAIVIIVAMIFDFFSILSQHTSEKEKFLEKKTFADDEKMNELVFNLYKTTQEVGMDFDYESLKNTPLMNYFTCMKAVKSY